tara:strand:+ start:190 stop:510 length:321 start_codon:yes stop_codon:yes gene_type:complete
MKNDQEIKKRITELINSREMTITAFAELIGTTRNNLSVVLNSDDKWVSSSVLRGIATLSVDMNWLFYGTGSMDGELKAENKEIGDLKRESIRKQDLIDSLERILKD